MHKSWAHRSLAAPFAILVFVALSTSAMAVTHPATRAGHPATASLTGQVRDGLPLERAKTASIVVPQGLPVVAGATVSLPALHRTATTSTDGQFSFTNLPVTTAARYTVVVTKKGFGRWQESGIRMYPGIGAQLYVEMHSHAITLRVPALGHQTYNGPSRGTRKPDDIEFCGHNSSGWTSESEQPSNIRVYMTGSGDVVNYDFTFYEQHVLPNEWEANWRPASLESGAVAVRDYAWYWILHGSKGTEPPANPDPCDFDVDNTTTYQDFQPSAPAYTSTSSAVDNTANALLTHELQIPETSFNAGDPGDTCGQDGGVYEQGTLSQNGSETCAVDGDSWQRILGIYYDYGLQIYGSRGPAAVVDKAGDQFVFWDNIPYGGLEESYYSASAGKWSSPGAVTVDGHSMGPMGSAPTVAITGQYSNGDPDQYVFWKGTGSASKLWMAYWAGGWHGPIDLGKGPLGSTPTAAGDTAGTVRVFWETPGRNLEEVSSSDPSSASSWSSPQEVRSADGGSMGPLGSSPSAAVNPATGEPYVFWKGAGGPLYFTYDDGSWHSPQSVPGTSPLGSPPSAAADQSGHVYVFWTNLGAGLEEVSSSTPTVASSYSHAAAVAGMGPLGSAPGAGVNFATGGLHLFWRGTNDGLWEGQYEGSWRKPLNLGDAPLG
jgi:Carboxypeptidase regulatory-like domain/Stage II sporulation protein